MPKYDRMADYKKKKIVRKKIKNVPPWTGTPQEKWAIEGRKAQDYLRKRRNKIINRKK